MKRILPIFLAALLLVGCAAPAEEITYRQVNMDEAITMMEEESGYIILDVRTPEEFAEKHIPGALNIPNETIGTEEIPELPDKDQLILVYCRSGNRSKQVSAGGAGLHQHCGIWRHQRLAGRNRNWITEICRTFHPADFYIFSD